MAESPIETTDQLRQWARGLYTTEAATELLIRAHHSTFASIQRPWIKPTDNAHWIDFPAITEHLGALSGGEQRLLRIAASIGSDEATPVRLGDVVSGLDRPTLRLVLAAVARAGGSPGVVIRSRRTRHNHQGADFVPVGWPSSPARLSLNGDRCGLANTGPNTGHRSAYSNVSASRRDVGVDLRGGVLDSHSDIDQVGSRWRRSDPASPGCTTLSLIERSPGRVSRSAAPRSCRCPPSR